MPRPSRTVGNFADVSQVLDAALAAGGARYRLASSGAAIHWRQRAYSLRSLLKKLDAQAKADRPGLAIGTKYDSLILRILEDEPEVVIIEVLQPHGQLEGMDGKPLQTGEATTHDPLLDEALALAKDLGL